MTQLPLYSKKEKSEQVWKTSSPIHDHCLLAQDLPIRNYDPEIGTERNSLIDNCNYVINAFPEVLKTVLHASEEEKENKGTGDEEGNRDDWI